ncbi:alpha/beta fold hydrolase [Pseudonocardia saturnea]
MDDHDRSVLVPVGDARIEVAIEGLGDPVLLIQTALFAEELQPLCREPALAGHRLIRTHRRGYGGSSPVTGVRSITAEAADCVAVLDALGVERAHVVGLSYSSTVAMQLAVDVPHRVHTLSLLEAPPLHVPSVVEFRAAIDELAAARAADGAVATLDLFQRRFLGPGWRAEVERAVPGAVAQMTQDAITFFDSDCPALLSWSFGREDAGRITRPLLYVGGSASGTWFDEVRDLLLGWFPGAENRTIEGADHNLAITHSGEIAAVLAEFLTRHPLPG